MNLVSCSIPNKREFCQPPFEDVLSSLGFPFLFLDGFLASSKNTSMCSLTEFSQSSLGSLCSHLVRSNSRFCKSVLYLSQQIKALFYNSMSAVGSFPTRGLLGFAAINDSPLLIWVQMLKC
jgi:hypothetical protein